MSVALPDPDGAGERGALVALTTRVHPTYRGAGAPSHLLFAYIVVMRTSTKRQTRREAGAQSHGPLEPLSGGRATERSEYRESRLIVPSSLRQDG
jgi:hypothetical protein